MFYNQLEKILRPLAAFESFARKHLKEVPSHGRRAFDIAQLRLPFYKHLIKTRLETDFTIEQTGNKRPHLRRIVFP
jgi:hypothetical protein